MKLYQQQARGARRFSRAPHAQDAFYDLTKRNKRYEQIQNPRIEWHEP
nr:MAG TPA: hypothetical protein [Caudoviricetes sp.]